MKKISNKLVLGAGLSLTIGLLSTGLTTAEDKYLLEPESMPTNEEVQYESDLQAVQAHLGTESSNGRISRDKAEAVVLDDPGLISWATEAMETKATLKASASTVVQINKAASWEAALRAYHTNGNIFGLISVEEQLQSRAYGVGGFLWHDFGYATQAGVLAETNAANSVGVLARNTSGQFTQGVALHAQASRESSTEIDPQNHAVILENTADNWPAVLALYMSGEIQSETTGWDNFITFIVRNNSNDGDVAIGSIEANGAGGVQLNTSGADIAEYLERADHSEIIESGDVVGVVDGKVTKETTRAYGIHVISSGPAVAGNSPGEGRGAQENHELIAFIGQAPVKVTGVVKAGDFIVASGSNDGFGIAVSPRDMTPDNYRLMVGRAWESSDDTRVKLINTAVGLGPNDTYAFMAEQQQIISDQNRRITTLEHRLSDKLAQLEQLSKTFESLTQRVAYIESFQMTASK